MLYPKDLGIPLVKPSKSRATKSVGFGGNHHGVPQFHVLASNSINRVVRPCRPVETRRHSHRLHILPDEATIKEITFKKSTGEWFATFGVEVDHESPGKPTGPTDVVVIDVGILK